MSVSRRSLRTLPALGLGTLLIAALLITSSLVRPASAQDASPEAGMGDAYVQVIHASPDAPAVDVYLNGAKALENVPFGATSGWVALPAGDYQVQVAATGSDPSTAVIDATLTLEGGKAYEVAAVGLLAAIQASVLETDVSATDPAGSARIRVVHASPDAPAVDIAVTGGDVLISNLAFPTASDYLTVPAGSYDLEVRPTGTTDVALPLPGVVLEADMAYSVYAVGQLADGTLTVLVIPAAIPGVMLPMATPEATPSA